MSGDVPWTLVITKPAARDLREPSSDDLRRTNATFVAMRADAYSGDIKFLRGTGGTLRRRVGVWRILFVVNQAKREVAILGVKRRTSTTY
jgi:mRNA-degrading endonuclease RelE of RelBE toxin-antitoxin system